ncbi:MAG: insulinase family protein [Acidobacteria bacterium]|nr:MAG: insulinase family protein [Acidobacteriota bacterium]
MSQETKAGTKVGTVPRIDFETYRLPNGLQVILHEDHKLPVAHVNLWYHVGSKNEQPGKTGFAHLFEHMMFEGSRNVKGEYVSLMERAGANISQGGINGTTNFDRTNYFETVPTGSLELVLWAESDRMGYLLDAVTQENLDNQRDVVKNERRQSMDNVPYGAAVEILFQNLFPKGHPYSWHIIGSMEDVSSASLEDIHAFFKKFYAPNNCVLTIAGEFDREATKALIENYFAPLPPGPPLERPERYEVKLDTDRRVTVYDRVPQERVYMAWPAVAFFEPDDAALDLVSTVLADGKNSRLYKRLVYDEQLASDVSAFNYSLEIAGLVGIVATARPGTPLAKLEQLIDEEVRRLAKEGPTDDEMARIKAGQEFDFLSGLERIGGFGGKADRLAMYQTFLGSPDFIEADYQRYQDVQAKDIRKATKRYLLKPRLVVSYLPETSTTEDRDEPDRSKKPVLKESPAFHVPEVASTKLSNGLKLYVVERREIPKVATALVVKVGATAESFERSGLASMTAEMLEEGTTTRTSLQIEAELDRMGSHLSTGGSREWSVVSLDALKRHLPDSLELMADVLLHPGFPGEELERCRKQRLDGFLQDRVSPGAIAGKAIRKALFGKSHPYGWPISGEEKSVEAMQRAELEQFYLTHYAPSNAVLIMVGDIGLEEAESLVERSFGHWEVEAFGEAQVEKVAPPSRVTYFVDRPGSAQSELRLAKLAPPRNTEDYYILEVLNNILGGGFSGRLNLNLREDKGFTYGASSSIRFATLQSILVGSAPVESSVTKDALEQLIAEFDALATWDRPVTDEELAHAKENLVRGFAQRYETLAQVAGEVAELDGYGLPLDEMSRYTDKIESITKEQLEAAASKYLSTEDAILLVIGDAEKVAASVASLEFGELTRLDADGEPIP